MGERPDLYRHSSAEAKEMNELDLWRASHKANMDCKRAIEEAVRAGFDGMHLSPDCAKGVIAEYGYHRVQYVLAVTLREKSYDGRFSHKNRAWFGGVRIPRDENYNYQLTVDSHPTILDGFMDEFRQEYQSLGLFGLEHCIQEEGGVDYTGKVVVVDPARLKEKALLPENQLWLAQSGFGCGPHSRGRAVFATCLGDGEKARWNRDSFLGAINEEYLPEWAKSQVEMLRAGQEIGPIKASTPAEGPAFGMTQSM